MDNGNNIVAIIDEKGNILSSNKEVKNLLSFLVEAPFTEGVLENKDKLGITMRPPKSEQELEEQLKENLPDFGYKL